MNWYKHSQTDISFDEPEANKANGIAFHSGDAASNLEPTWGDHEGTYSGIYLTYRYENSREYGYPAAFNIGDQNILDLGSESARELVAGYLLLDNTDSGEFDDAIVDLQVDPADEWIDILKQRGYTGFGKDDDIFIFDPMSITRLG